MQICIHVYERLFVTADNKASTRACSSMHACMGNCHVMKQVQKLHQSMNSAPTLCQQLHALRGVSIGLATCHTHKTTTMATVAMDGNRATHVSS